MSTTVLPNNFSPKSIPGLTAWFDGADRLSMIFGTGNAVSSWIDKSGNGNTVSQATSGQQPASVQNAVNGLSVVRFTGSSSTNLQTSTFTSLGTLGLTFILVERNMTDSGVAGAAPFSFSSGPNGGLVFQNNGGLLQPCQGVPFTSTSQRIDYYYRKNTSGTGTSATFINGTSVTCDDNLTGTYSTTFGVGVRLNSNITTLTGDICEIIIYNTVLTTAQRQQMEGYLGWKWGLQASLDSSNPYKTSNTYPPAFPTNPNISSILGSINTSSFIPNNFLPTQIPGCQLWLDAADTTTYTSSSSVTSWINKGTAGGTCSRTNGTFNSTSFTINSVRAMALSSGATMSTPTLTFGTTSRSIFLVPNIGGTGSQYTYTGAGTLVDPQCYTWSGAPDLELNKPGLNILVTNSPTNYFNSTSIVSITSGININGTAQTLSVNNGNSLFNTGVTTTLTLGGSDTAAYNLGEIIIFDGLLTTAQRQQMEGYLAWKWGLQASLDSSNPYKTSNTYPAFPTSSIPLTILRNTNSSAIRQLTFNPKSIAGTVLWLDGADTSNMTFSSGTTISTWKDKSGNANNATATGSPTLAQNSINGVQAVTAAVGTCFGGALSISGPSLTCFGVAITNVTLPNVRSPRADQRLVSLANGTNPDYQNGGMIPLFNQDSTSTIAAWNYNYNPNGILASNPISTGAPFMAVSRLDGTTASLWFNGAPGSLTSSSFTNSITTTKYGIGNQANPTIEYWSGFIGEIILFSTALTISQRQQVEGYLAWKWGLQGSLPATHPYKSFPPPP